MAGLLKDMSDFIQSKGITASIFDDTLLDTPDKAIALIEYTGASSLPQIEGALRSVQVQVRDKSSSGARSLANTLYGLLHTETGIVTFTQNRVALVSMRQPPFKHSVDDKNRTLYCFNVGVMTQLD